MRWKKEFDEILMTTVLVSFSPSYRLGDFDCDVGDYNDWLTYDAQHIIAEGITQVQLLVNPENDDIVAYMALCADSFLVASEEKAKLHLQSIPYSSFPALKIGKLAVDKTPISTKRTVLF